MGILDAMADQEEVLCSMPNKRVYRHQLSINIRGKKVNVEFRVVNICLNFQ
jgi:hypothetical protein